MREPRDERLSLSGEQKLKSVEDQYELLRRGQLKVLTCPYCESMNAEGVSLCCELLSQAVMAILDREEVQEQISLAEQISDKAESQLAVERAEDVLAKLR